MNENEKPLSDKFWTFDVILLVGVNLAFIGLIVIGFCLLYPAFVTPVQAWLERHLGL